MRSGAVCIAAAKPCSHSRFFVLVQFKQVLAAGHASIEPHLLMLATNIFDRYCRFLLSVFFQGMSIHQTVVSPASRTKFGDWHLTCFRATICLDMLCYMSALLELCIRQNYCQLLVSFRIGRLDLHWKNPFLCCGVVGLKILRVKMQQYGVQ